MTALYIAAAWIGAGVLLAPLVSRYLKHCATHDAPQGRNGDLP